MARRRIPKPFRAAFPRFAGPVWGLLLLALLSWILLLEADYALAAVGRFLVVEDNPAKADAIVVLSGDGGARLEQGVQLFQGGHAPLLILVGGGQEGSPSAAEVMRRQAAAMGVPPSGMLLVNRSTSTREDALYTRELMVQKGLKSAILVTSPYHQRRASLTFARVFQGSDVSVASYPVQDDLWQPDSWWKSEKTLRLTLMELAKLAYYKLYGYL
ncbi:MAG: YdcF family protein [Chloroflexota bacterium]